MSGAKFGRSYILTVQIDDAGTPLSIPFPFTLEFDINRKLYSSANEGSFRLLNLNAAHRNQIRKNAWDIGTYRQLQLRAGYLSTSSGLTANLPVVFQGNISQAHSKREGVNFYTSIEAFDGGFAYAYPQANNNPLPAFPSGTTNQAIIETLAGELPKVSLGAIGTYSGSAGLGASFTDPATSVLSELTGKGFFIDNEIANCLNTNEVIQDSNILIVSAASGLLNTPVLEQTFLYFDMIFEPSLYIGQQIILDSITDFKFNGPAKVISIHHRGTISGAVCGEATTTVGLDIGSNIFTAVPRAVA